MPRIRCSAGRGSLTSLQCVARTLAFYSVYSSITGPKDECHGEENERMRGGSGFELCCVSNGIMILATCSSGENPITRPSCLACLVHLHTVQGWPPYRKICSTLDCTQPPLPQKAKSAISERCYNGATRRQASHMYALGTRLSHLRQVEDSVLHTTFVHLTMRVSWRELYSSFFRTSLFLALSIIHQDSPNSSRNSRRSQSTTRSDTSPRRSSLLSRTQCPDSC